MSTAASPRSAKREKDSGIEEEGVAHKRNTLFLMGELTQGDNSGGRFSCAIVMNGETTLIVRKGTI